jgi:hypothetical protein
VLGGKLTLAPVVVDGRPRLTTTALLAQEHAIVQAAKAI